MRALQWPLLVYCWSIINDIGPALNQHWVNVSCLHKSGIKSLNLYMFCRLFPQSMDSLQVAAGILKAIDPVFRHVIGRDGHLDQPRA